MNNDDVVSHYKKIMSDDPDVSQAIAAIKTLMEVIRCSKNETLTGLIADLKKAIDSLTSTDHNGCITSIESGCQLFLHFITLSRGSIDSMDFKQCQEFLFKRGEQYMEDIRAARRKIAKEIQPFIREKMTVLTHSRSRVVLQVLKNAADKHLKVYVTESQPDSSGLQMVRDLSNSGLNVILILDAQVSSIINEVDLVILGAEGVAGTGGVINKIGTCNVAALAHFKNKPVYVVVESFKFVKVFPTDQRSIPNKFKYPASKLKSGVDLARVHPFVDYTPPEYIKFLFTDIGILPPPAVSDEILRLYL